MIQVTEADGSVKMFRSENKLIAELDHGCLSIFEAAGSGTALLPPPTRMVAAFSASGWLFVECG